MGLSGDALHEDKPCALQFLAGSDGTIADHGLPVLLPHRSTVPLSARLAFLSGLIDYAGLFPPAELALEPALDLYGRYRTGDDAWMLGRFLIPAARLEEADPLVEHIAGTAPVEFSVLGGAAADAETWLGTAEAVVAGARAFEARHGGRATVDAFEVRTPPALARDADALAGVLMALAPRLEESRMAVEIPYLTDGDTVGPAVNAIAEANRKVGEAHGRAGRPLYAAKFRCGGEGVPGVEALAHALTEARRAGVAFKATAGLHHPLRHDDASGEAAHGFVNVFGGAVLAAVHDLPADDLAELLDSRDAAEWRLGDDLSWRRLEARSDQIATAREAVALAYGSCSFDEPRDDLRALGWL